MRLLGGGWLRRPVLAVVAAGTLALLLPMAASAHPLGNFTINHYAGLRVAPDEVSLDVVIDHAEIPTFQESTRIDLDADGTLSEREIETERLAACPRLAADLSLMAGSAPLVLSPTAAGLTFPLGASAAQTMRLVCEFSAALPSSLSAVMKIRFEDRSWADRIGWREIVAQGDGMTLTSSLPATSMTNRLTSYPTDLLAQPLDVRTGVLAARAGGSTLPLWSAPDAMPFVATGAASSAPSGAPASSAGQPAVASPGQATVAPAPAAVPGGVAGEISGLLATSDLTPLVLVLSFLTAAALGAGHAVTPGHGKTIMAAYLVGTRGTARHALGLGLATAVSHTIGVLALAVLIVVAGSALPADRVYPVLSAISGVIVVVIGAWLLATQLTRWLHIGRRPAMVGAAAGVGVHGHSHTDGRSHARSDAHGHGHPRERAFGQRHASVINRESEATVDDHAEELAGRADAPAGTHRHGWSTHSHVAADAGAVGSLSWRSLFALGLSGGLVPSTNALLILVATVAAGRAAYGVVLVIAFGLGMAAVLVGVGLALVYASGMLSRIPRTASMGRIVALAPTVAAAAVLVLGLYLTTQAIAGSRVL